MDPTLLSSLILVLMFVLLFCGMPIGFAMGLSAFVGTLLLIDAQAALALLGQTAYDTAVTYNLSVVPMFVLMGYIAGNARLSEALYRACNAWLGHRRGGLALARQVRPEVRHDLDVLLRHLAENHRMDQRQNE